MLDIKNVSLAYQDSAILHNLDLTLDQGELACLLGPSGCGKTSLLRAIAGFEPITSGLIQLQNQRISEPGKTLAPEQRQIGMMFQYFALFPHLTVAENIQFGIRKQSKKDQQSRTKTLLQLVDLPGVEDRYPHTLSGGQQQRVALARALAPRPDLLLMDEPFSSMDHDLREEIAREVRTILKKEGITALLVTHDQNEAFALADQIAIMQSGKIEQTAPAHCLYQRPLTRFVAGFIGEGSFISASPTTDDRLNTALGNLDAAPESRLYPDGMEILLRPEHLQLSESTESLKTGKVVESLFRGIGYLYTLELGNGEQIKAVHNSPIPFAQGKEIGIALNVTHAPVFAKV